MFLQQCVIFKCYSSKDIKSNMKSVCLLTESLLFGEPANSDDIFSFSLVASDLDRQFEAWIPCKSTQHILESISAGSLSSSVVQIEQMSCPSIINEESQVISSLTCVLVHTLHI